MDRHAFGCTIPCGTVIFNCHGSGMQVEWLNPDNVVINSFIHTTIQSKKMHMLITVLTLKLMYILAIPGTGLLIITDPQVIDSGIYTCRAKANHSDYDEITLTITSRKIT